VKNKEIKLLSAKNLPNCITSLRILGTASLLFVDPFTSAFFAIYTLSGLSDVFDGAIARLMKTTSRFGAKLDSVADMLFYAVMIFKIFPVLWSKLPKIFWIVLCCVVSVRIIAYTVAALKYHRFSSLHTHMNKLSGFAVFTVPYFIHLGCAVPLCWTVCVISGIASLEELIIHIRSKDYSTENKSIFAA